MCSTVAASVVLRATKVEEEVPREEQETQSPAAVVDAPRIMDIDDDDGTFCQGRSYFMFLPILTKYIQISMGILRTRLRQFPTRLQEGTLHLWNFDPLSIFLYVIHCLLMVPLSSNQAPLISFAYPVCRSALFLRPHHATHSFSLLDLRPNDRRCLSQTISSGQPGLFCRSH